MLDTRSLFSILGNSIIAGGLSGIAVDITLYPLDTIKTRL